MACGLGTAYAACLRAAVSGRDTVLVTGLGPVGLAVSMLCQALGARVVGTDTMPERRELAEKLTVCTVVAPPDPEDLKAALLAETNGHGYEVGIDCSGNGVARRLCLEVAREWGRVVYVGEGGLVEFAPSPLLIHKQITLHGSWVCSMPQMIDLVEHLVRWGLHPDRMVTHTFSLDQAKEAYETFDQGKTGKVAIVWE